MTVTRRISTTGIMVCTELLQMQTLLWIKSQQFHFLAPATDAQKTKLIGEARFLRAWAYFYAVRLWGDIPLITTPQTANSTDFLPSRAPQEEVYKLIVEDLLAAEAAGLPVTETNGRATQIAAKSLLSKVYLTMAGFPLSKGATHYKLAADKALEVINYSKANPTDT